MVFLRYAPIGAACLLTLACMPEAGDEYSDGADLTGVVSYEQALSTGENCSAARNALLNELFPLVHHVLDCVYQRQVSAELWWKWFGSHDEDAKLRFGAMRRQANRSAGEQDDVVFHCGSDRCDATTTPRPLTGSDP